MKNKNLFLRRVSAFAIDLIVVYVTARTAEFNHGELLVAWLAYEAFSIHWKGFTLGKYALGLRVKTLKNKRVPISKAFIRAAVKLLSTVVLLGDLWMLWDKRSQTWHDKWAGTVVQNVK
jgi:uncharacterized RDD family membrane protein YckC